MVEKEQEYGTHVWWEVVWNDTRTQRTLQLCILNHDNVDGDDIENEIHEFLARFG